MSKKEETHTPVLAHATAPERHPAVPAPAAAEYASQFGQFINHLQVSPDPECQLLASAITGTPVGSRTAAGGNFFSRVDWNVIGPMTVALCLKLLHEKNPPTTTNSQGDVKPLPR